MRALFPSLLPLRVVENGSRSKALRKKAHGMKTPKKNRGWIFFRIDIFRNNLFNYPRGLIVGEFWSGGLFVGGI